MTPKQNKQVYFSIHLWKGGGVFNGEEGMTSGGWGSVVVLQVCYCCLLYNSQFLGVRWLEDAEAMT